MERNIRVAMISLAVVLLVGIGLYFWVYDPDQREDNFIECEETMTQSAQGQKIYTASEAESAELAENHVESDDSAEEQGQNANETKEQPTETPEEVTLVFAGDIYLSSYVQNNYNSNGIYGVVSELLLTEMHECRNRAGKGRLRDMDFICGCPEVLASCNSAEIINLV